MFRLQVTIIMHILQYMGMTCSVLQCGIQYCLHLMCGISDSKCKQYGVPYCSTEHVMPMN